MITDEEQLEFLECELGIADRRIEVLEKELERAMKVVDAAKAWSDTDRERWASTKLEDAVDEWEKGNES